MTREHCDGALTLGASPIAGAAGRGADETASPELADAAAAAQAHGVPVKEVLAAAVGAYRKTLKR